VRHYTVKTEQWCSKMLVPMYIIYINIVKRDEMQPKMNK